VEAGRVADTIVAGGVDLACWQRGSGPPVLLLHEIAASAEVWRPLAEQLGEEARAIAFDRRGWGRSGTPEPYLRTTIEEQGEDAADVLEQLAAERALACGSGLGAVVALDLLVRRPGLLRAAVLIEPPLLAFLPDATEGLSTDRQAIEQALRDGGPAGALELYLGGGLPFLGPGAERIPEPVSSGAWERPLSLFAELAAVSDWPIRPAQLRQVETPSLIVTGRSTPAVLQQAAQALAARLGATKLISVGAVGGEGLPHVDSAGELAAAMRELIGPAAARPSAGR
jgi:pimeloyl-ACP methyl ester carboxylesterase